MYRWYNIWIKESWVSCSIMVLFDASVFSPRLWQRKNPPLGSLIAFPPRLFFFYLFFLCFFLLLCHCSRTPIIIITLIPNQPCPTTCPLFRNVGDLTTFFLFTEIRSRRFVTFWTTPGAGLSVSFRCPTCTAFVPDRGIHFSGESLPVRDSRPHYEMKF